MSNIETDGKDPKKNRKRLKKLYQQIREQVEFYLSDANLQKDRFFRQEMNNSPNGDIDLELFLRCNKIRALTSDIDVLTSAVSTSKALKVNKELKRVGRLVAYSEPRNVDERTVYVECLPNGIDREWLRSLFSSCGSVVYISLPRFKSTNDIKGFAFVEFESTDAASKACELMNRPPAEALGKVGRFPRSKQLKLLEKQVKIRETAGRKRRASESELDSDQPKIKRKRTLSEGRDNDVESTLSVRSESSTKQELHTPKRKRRKSSENLETKEERLSKSESKGVATSSKTIKVKREASTIKQSEEMLDQKTSSKKAKLESDGIKHNNKTKRDSSKKIKSREEAEDTSSSLETNRKRRAQSGEEPESSEKKVKRVKICEEPKAEKEQRASNDEQKAKRKRHKKNKNKTKIKDVPELRVIPKVEWLRCRTEYLQIQRENMTQLKEKLRQLRTDESKVNKDNLGNSSLIAATEPGANCAARKGDPEFIEGVIVKVTTEQSTTRKDLKERIWTMGSIAYIDFKDGDSAGHIRCNDAETSSAIAGIALPGFNFQQLSGEEELNYWKKLRDDRNKKLDTKKHSKQRGRDKILHKADIAYEKLKKPMHVIFD